VLHACNHAIVTDDLDPDADPPKLLFIGPDRAGRLVEVIALALAGERLMAIHAMPLRTAFQELLPPQEQDPDA